MLGAQHAGNADKNSPEPNESIEPIILSYTSRG